MRAAILATLMRSVVAVLAGYGASADAGEIDTPAARLLDGRPAYTGAVYYVDGTSGSDSADGLSPATAWRTVAKVQTALFALSGAAHPPAGSAVLFRRGCAYTGNLNVYGDTAGLTIGAWGTGARPQITWASGNANDAAQVIGVAAQSSIGLKHGFTVRNLRIIGRGTSYQTAEGVGGLWCDNILYENLEISDCGGNGITVWMSDDQGITATPWPTYKGATATVRNCIVHDCCAWTDGGGLGQNGSGIDGGWGSGLLIERCTVYDCGRNGGTSHAIYVDDCPGAVLRNNWCYCTKLESGNCGIVVHGNVATLTISDNLVDGYNNGINVTGGYATVETMTAITITRNVLRNLGAWRTSPQGTGITADGVVGLTITNNLIYGGRGDGIALNPRQDASETLLANASVLHNTIVIPDQGAARYGSCITLGANATSYGPIAIKGNILANASTSANGMCLIVPQALQDMSQIDLDGNLYRRTGAPGSVVQRYTTIDTLASLQAATGKEAHGRSGDPLFVSSADYRVHTGSPALSGIATGVTIDLLGAARSVTPTIGAYEAAV